MAQPREHVIEQLLLVRLPVGVQAMRGLDLVAAVTVLAEIGELSRQPRIEPP
jgi:hypothetical protein